MQSLLSYNTFGIDQGCHKIYEPQTEKQLLEALPVLHKEPLLIIGGGSNLLLTKDFEGNVLHTAIKGIEPLGKGSLRCGAGETWDMVVAKSLTMGLYGLENLSAIPGEVGASAVQNIGAYGVEVCEFIQKIEAIEIETGEKVIIQPEECCYGYRYSKFKDEWHGKYVITYVTYRLSETFQPRIGYSGIMQRIESEGIINPSATDVRRIVTMLRTEKLPNPKHQGNAGSFFMNPVVGRDKYLELKKHYPDMPHYTQPNGNEKIPAGWMIEQCGWKGRSLGRAGVYEKQALVLVNLGGATGQEVLQLCEEVRRSVNERFGIMINPEVNII